MASAAVGPANRDPGQALDMPIQNQGISPNTSQWYRFGFSGGDTKLTKITIPYGSYNNLKFEVYAPGQMAKWWDAEPIGRSGADGDDLVWAGDLHSSGVYYVKVVNDNPNGVGFVIQTSNIPH